MNNIIPQIYEAREFIPRDAQIAILYSENTPESYPAQSDTIYQRNFWKIVYVEQGEGIMRINDQNYPVSPGFIGIIHPRDFTTYQLREKIMIYNILFFRDFIAAELNDLYDADHFFAIFESQFAPGKALCHELLHLLDANRNILAIIRKMFHEFQSDDINSQRMLRHQLMELLIQLARLSFKSGKSRHVMAADFIDRYLREHYSEPLNIDWLANELGVSKGYLFCLYRRQTNSTIGNMLLRIRLNEAIRRLRKNKDTIEHICYECGFDDPGNFYRVFKRETGQSPSDFRPTIKNLK